MLKFALILLFGGVLFSQNNETKISYKEPFCIRAFTYSKQHYLARLSYNNQTIYIDNLVHPEKRKIIFSNENKGIKYLSFDDSEKYLAAASYSGIIDIWDLDKRKLHMTVKLHDGAVNMVKFISNALISAGNDGQIYKTPIDQTGNPILIGYHKGIIRAIDVSENKRFLTSVGNDKTVIIWDLEKQKKLVQSKRQESVLTTVKFNKTGERLVVGDIEGYLSVFNVEALNRIEKIKPHDNIITSMSFIDNKQLITTSFDGSVKRINLNSFKIETVFTNKNYIINSSVSQDTTLAFSDSIGNLFEKKLILPTDAK